MDVLAGLNTADRAELARMIDTMQPSREQIRACVAWCVQRPAYAADIVQRLAAALQSSDEGPMVRRKAALLFVVSDLLHFSCTAVSHISDFREHLQAALPDIFASLHLLFSSYETRVPLETLRDVATKLLRIWQAWSLFPLSFTARLEQIFLHGEAAVTAGTAASSATDCSSQNRATATGTAQADPLDGQPMMLTDGSMSLQEAMARDGVGSAAAFFSRVVA